MQRASLCVKVEDICISVTFRVVKRIRKRTSTPQDAIVRKRGRFHRSHNILPLEHLVSELGRFPWGSYSARGMVQLAVFRSLEAVAGLGWLVHLPDAIQVWDPT